MKALVYHGQREVSGQEVPDAKTGKSGFAGLGLCSGGQAESLRRPFGGH